MNGNSGNPTGVIAPVEIVVLVNYERALTLYQQMRGLHEGLRGGSAERGLATKIQGALELGSSVDGNLLQAVYGQEAVSVAEMQAAVDEVLNPRGLRSPYFTRENFPAFQPNSPHCLHD